MSESIEKMEMTLKEHEELFSKFANKKCKKCYGRGYIGWTTVKGKKIPIPCKAKKCSVYNLYVYQLQQKRQELLAKQKLKKMEEKAGVEEKENDNK